MSRTCLQAMIPPGPSIYGGDKRPAALRGLLPCPGLEFLLCHVFQRKLEDETMDAVGHNRQQEQVIDPKVPQSTGFDAVGIETVEADAGA